MRNWTTPVCLLLLLTSVLSSGQEQQKSNSLEKFGTGFKALTQNSILRTTEETQSHSFLLKALRASDLDCILDYDGQFTVFAPSNSAFDKLSEVTNKLLLNPENKEKLKAIMSYHIIAGNLSASKILRAMCRGEGKASFTTILGEKITATMNGIDIVLTDNHGNKAKITSADSRQRNGVIHEIDSVFFPVDLF